MLRQIGNNFLNWYYYDTLSEGPWFSSAAFYQGP